MSAESESETSWAWAAVALAACVALVAPWPEGAVLPLGAWLPELAGAALLILCAARPELLGRGPSRGERLLGVALLGLILLAILQLLPLGGALETISPNSVRSRAPFVPAGRSAPSTLTLYPYKTRLVLCAWVTAAALLVAARGASRRQARWIAGALVVAATLQAVVGIGLHLAGSTLPWVDAHSPSRAHGSFRNANHFAGLLLMALPLSLALSGLANRRPGARVGAEVLWLVPAGLLALGILLSGSRGGALATLIAMAVFVVLLVPGGPKHISRGFLALTSGTVLLVGLAGVSSLADRFLGLTEGKLSVLRPSLWRTALGIWSDFPLLGAGVRSHEQLTPARREGSQLLNATHNDYLNLLADCGLAGALLGAVALGALVWVVRKRALALPSGPERTLFAAAAAGVLGLLSAVVVEFHLQISANLWACALACGLLLGAGSRRSAPRASRALRVALLLAGGLLAVDATRQAVAEWQ
ncbi:MAG TPA: hypothetical protein DEA08_37815, partial [Planctomycetes bacterium]|nr:hypothetical protein [Planctomycetota bacterium]